MNHDPFTTPGTTEFFYTNGPGGMPHTPVQQQNHSEPGFIEQYCPRFIYIPTQGLVYFLERYSWIFGVAYMTYRMINGWQTEGVGNSIGAEEGSGIGPVEVILFLAVVLFTVGLFGWFAGTVLGTAISAVLTFLVLLPAAIVGFFFSFRVVRYPCYLGFISCAVLGALYYVDRPRFDQVREWGRANVAEPAISRLSSYVEASEMQEPPVPPEAVEEAAERGWTPIEDWEEQWGKFNEPWE